MFLWVFQIPSGVKVETRLAAPSSPAKRNVASEKGQVLLYRKTLFVAEGFDRVEARGADGRDHAADQSDDGEDKDSHD